MLQYTKKEIEMLEHLGKLTLRLTLGGMLLLHGIQKVNYGIGFIKTLLKTHGIPEVVAYGVFIGEILAPLLLMIGWKSRLWAAIIAFNMLMILYLVHLKDLVMLNSHGGWAVELQMFYFLTAITILFLGSGKYALSRD
jgi:putative oxidoreductase